MALYLVLDEGSSLNVSPGLVGDLHDELSLRLDAEVEDGEVHGGAQVVDVGQEDDFPALVQQLLHEAGVVERLVEVSVAWRVPARKQFVKKIFSVDRSIHKKISRDDLSFYR